MFPLEAKTNLNINDLNGFLDQTTWKESIELVWTISVQVRVSTFFTTLLNSSKGRIMKKNKSIFKDPTSFRKMPHVFEDSLHINPDFYKTLTSLLQK